LSVGYWFANQFSEEVAVTQKKGKIKMLFEKSYLSPLGRLRLVCSDRGLRAILFENHKEGKVRLADKITIAPDHPFFTQVERELSEYFWGKRLSFGIALDFSGASEFQFRVWQSLLQIPYGQTISYSDQSARLLGLKQSHRAVALANSKNPLSIVVPCHRVVSASGKLHGYAGGLDQKRQLLHLEASLAEI